VSTKDYGLKLLPTHMMMKARAIKGGVKTIEHGTEMSDATMDLMIKYNVLHPLSAGSFVKKH
jgi:imidazolonepropionase-like amidohydrolase